MCLQRKSMSKSNRYIFDTNTAIELLSEKISFVDLGIDSQSYIIIPGVVYLELLSKDFSPEKLINIQNFLNKFEVSEAGLHEYIVAAKLRRENKGLKTPDSIVVATALTKQAVLVTGDTLLLKIEGLKTVDINNL